MRSVQGRRNVKAAYFFYITLTYKKDTILFISIGLSVFSKIPLSYQSILSLFIYTYLYVTIFKLLIIFGSQNMGGGLPLG